MRIAVDIDSTLHHYWDGLSDAARRRFGIELPYEEQLDWGITRLRPEQLAVCVAETHCDAAILRNEPYPGAVETVNRWHAAGHFIHVTSHRPGTCAPATAAWLERIGLAHDDLWCSDDKLARCVQLGIDVLVDDSPDNIRGALEQGMLAATLVHPWNEEVCETEDVVAAADWEQLATRLEPRMAERERLAPARPAR
ncbi:MAG TPA: hypothetical protein VHB30_07485 [Solirubrobacteraceae bacterium]|jgi:hypothetical protein|nr:hypothetical protein [Solirubrobacteraceae bacterium]